MGDLEGVGLYIRGLSKSKHGTPAQAAKKAADHGLSHVAIMSDWQDYRKGKFSHLRGNMRKNRWKAYAEAFKKKDITVGLWFYPWAGHEDRLLKGLDPVCETGLIDYLLPDPELGFKWKGGRRSSKTGTMRGGQPEAIKGVSATGTQAHRRASAKKLMEGLKNMAHEHRLVHGVGVTSYGVAKYHPTLPWKQFLENADFLSPQLYTASPKQVDAGIQQWYKHAKDYTSQLLPMLPSIGTFGAKSGSKMHDHLSAFVDGNEGIDGFIGWSWRQTSRDEWRVLARWAEWLDRGVCWS